MPSGGKRPNAGRPPGRRNNATLSKEQAREALRLIVLEDMREMTAAQIAQAKGIAFLVVREKSSGKFLRVGKGRAERLKPEEEIIEIWEKDPSTAAYADLMNRAMDKPKEQEQEIKLTGEAELIGALMAGRKRAAEQAKSPAK